MIDRIFEWLFKYRPVLFREGELEVSASPVVITVVAIVALAVVPVLLRYVANRTALGRDRWILVSLRLGILVILLVCLLQPSLVLSTVIPHQSFVGVLVDNSRSMQVADEQGSRGEVARRALSSESGELLKTLNERFKVRMFGFAGDVRRIEDVGELSFDGPTTALAAALQRSAEELGSVPLSGLVLLSDGADNSGSTGLSDVLLELRARSVPVSTVALGSERFDRDIEVSRVVAPRSVLKGASLIVEVTLEQTGFSGSKVTLEVLDNGRLLSAKEVRFPTSGEAVTERVSFAASEPGPRRFSFRVTPQPNEVITQNNQRVVLMEVADRREKILYFEGEPRFELKFLRRAVADDENLQVTCLQRTAESKFLRLDVDDGSELEIGFPTTREELFKYRGLILGSIEASFFTYDQMRMIVDFVGQRGGGFLMLGGRQSFSEGGYAGTPIADLLPVILGTASGGEGEPFFSELQVSLTPYGRNHAVTQLLDDEEASAERWATLPPLTTFNPVTRLKAGASALLTGSGEGLPGEQVVLAHQRYGRGRALAFTVHDSWLWQMDSSIDLEDMTHETLWRQLLRWLVSYVPDPVSVSTDRDRLAPGEPVSLVADVRDVAHLEVNSAQVLARVERPDGVPVEVPLEWTVQEDGRFEGRYVPSEEGIHTVVVEARDGQDLLGTHTTHFEAADTAAEMFDAERRTALLERISNETGGRLYTASRMRNIAEDLSYSEGGSTVIERRDLWDMPVLFLAVLFLLSTEWSYRKWRGLA